MERGEIAEVGPPADRLGVLIVDRLDLQQGKVFLLILRRSDLSADDVPILQAEALDLGRGDVDIVLPRQAGAVAQEAIAVRKNLQHSIGEPEPLLFGLGLEDGKDQLILPQPGAVVDSMLFC